MLTIATLAAVLVAVGTPTATPSSTPDPLHAVRATLDAARKTLYDNFKAVDQRSGLAAALEERLDGDSPGEGLTEKPDWMSTADYVDYMTSVARLEKSIIEQYASGSYHPLGAIRGADETVFKSPADGTMQPLAAYVPKSYDPLKPSSLVVFLHGRTVSENYYIGSPWLRAAADSTNTIIVAPYARGDSQYVDPASAEVYAALDVAEKAFNIDARRVYLAGHSMGGYGVFIVGPKHPEYWAAVLAVSGGMTTETVTAALKGFQGVPVYLVIGSNDPIVPQGYMKQNEDLLTKSGVETHYYEEPGGLHFIGTISHAFGRAWHDMLARVLQKAPPVDRSGLPVAPQMRGVPTAMPTRPTRS